MRARRAYILLALLPIVMSVLALLAAVHYYGVSQANERRQGAVLEQRLCTSLHRLAALTPPPGSAADNPSRAYLQGQHAVLAELGPDIGCKGGHR